LLLMKPLCAVYDARAQWPDHAVDERSSASVSLLATSPVVTRPELIEWRGGGSESTREC
jgi:hypothetical protein